MQPTTPKEANMNRHNMSWRDFIFNLILTLVIIAGFVYAAREGMLSAIKTVDAREAAMWSVAIGNAF